MKPKLLHLSDGAGLTTGYSTISRKLLNYLAEKGWECHYLAHTGVHQTYKPGVELEDGEKFNFTLHGSGMQPYSQDLIMPKIAQLKPEIFGILLDTFMCYPWLLNLDFAPVKSYFYFPSDGGGGMPLNCEQILRKVDCPIAMSKYGQKQVKELYNIDTEYIPHAIEPDIYFPLNDQEKTELRGKWGLADKFVIGVVARAQPRKMLDRTLYAFKKVAEKIPNAVLLFHCDRNDPANYFNFDVLINQLQLQNRVFFTGTSYINGFDYKKMNEVYNVMDIFFLGTSGEGFGIPIIEAMACEIPVITTDYTTGPELVGDTNAGELIKVKEEILGNWHVNRAIIDIDHGAELMIKMFENPELRKEYGKNGREAVMREYTWPIVAEKWDKVLRNLL